MKQAVSRQMWTLTLGGAVTRKCGKKLATACSLYSGSPSRLATCSILSRRRYPSVSWISCNAGTIRAWYRMVDVEFITQRRFDLICPVALADEVNRAGLAHTTPIKKPSDSFARARGELYPAGLGIASFVTSPLGAYPLDHELPIPWHHRRKSF